MKKRSVLPTIMHTPDMMNPDLEPSGAILFRYTKSIHMIIYPLVIRNIDS